MTRNRPDRDPFSNWAPLAAMEFPGLNSKKRSEETKVKTEVEKRDGGDWISTPSYLIGLY